MGPSVATDVHAEVARKSRLHAIAEPSRDIAVWKELVRASEPGHIHAVYAECMVENVLSLS